jgi:hypothetical protein
MKIRAARLRVLAVAAAALPLAQLTSAQVTTGTVARTVKDAQGGGMPGAALVLVSESRGMQSSPVIASETGDFVFPIESLGSNGKRSAAEPVAGRTNE